MELLSIDAAVLWLHDQGMHVSREMIRRDLVKGAAFGEREDGQWRIRGQELLRHFRQPRPPRGPQPGTPLLRVGMFVDTPQGLGKIMDHRYRHDRGQRIGEFAVLTGAGLTWYRHTEIKRRNHSG